MTAVGGGVDGESRTRDPRRFVTWALADQALISGCNFLTVLIVARALTPDAFGLYTVAYTSLYISNTLQSSLIAQPHAVLSASRLGRAYVDYTTSTGVMQLALGALVFLAAVVGAVVAGQTSMLAPLILALGLAAVAWQFQEFSRRVLYVENRPAAATLNDVVSYGGQLILVLGLAGVGSLSEVAAVLAIGGTSLAAAGLGVVQLRKSLVGRPSARDVAANLRFGKWLAASELAGIFSFRLWAYLVGVIAGAAAAGAYGAASLVFGPINVIVFSMATILPIRYSQALVEGGERRLRALVERLHLLTVPPVVALCVGAGLLAEPISAVLFQGKYPAAPVIIQGLAAYNLVRYLQTLVSSGLSAAHRTRAIFASSLLSAGITGGIGWWLVAHSGASGAALGLFIATTAALVANWAIFLRSPLVPARADGSVAAGDREAYESVSGPAWTIGTVDPDGATAPAQEGVEPTTRESIGDAHQPAARPRPRPRPETTRS